MVHQYKVPIKKIEDAMIEVKECMPIMLKLKKGYLISAVITKVEKDFVIAETKQ